MAGKRKTSHRVGKTAGDGKSRPAGPAGTGRDGSPAAPAKSHRSRRLSAAKVPAAGFPLPVFSFPPNYQEKPKNYLFRGEAHDGYEICYLDRGALNVLVGKEGFRGEPGDLFLFAPWAFHAVWSEKETAPNFVGVHFIIPRSRTGGERFSDLSPVTNHRLRLTEEERGLFSKFCAAAGQSTGGETAENLSARLWLGLLLVELAKRARETTTKEMEARSEKPSRRTAENAARELAGVVEEFLDRNLERSLDSAAVAAALCVGESHLRHAFKRAAGSTVTQRLSEKRIARAKVLLRETSLTVTEISRRCGFSSVHAFSRAFKRAVRMTPVEYGRSVRE